MDSAAFGPFQARFPYLNTTDVAEVMQHARTRELVADEVLFKAGKTEMRGAVVLSGLLRNYHTLANGTERTVLFTPEGQGVAPYATLFFGLPGRESTVAVEKTVIIEFDMRGLRKAIEENPRLTRAYAQLLELMLTEAISRIDSFVLQSPEERYTKFGTDYPHLANRIPLKYLASYLGITPVSLSRLRARVLRGN